MSISKSNWCLGLMKKSIYHKANVIFSNLLCVLSMLELLQSNAGHKIIFTFFTIADITCCAWSNIIFTWFYYLHHFYYVPIITGHVNNILWKKKILKNILCLYLLHPIKTIIRLDRYTKNFLSGGLWFAYNKSDVGSDLLWKWYCN